MEAELTPMKINIVKEGIESRCYSFVVQSKVANALYAIMGTCGLGSLLLIHHKNFKESALMLLFAAFTAYTTHRIKKKANDNKKKCEKISRIWRKD